MSKITLRKLTASDVDVLLAINLNPDVTKYIPFMIQDRNVLLSWINGLGTTDHEFMILRHLSNNSNSCVDNSLVAKEEIIGECSLDGNGEIGLMILPEYWRQGYGTDTVKQLMQIAHDLGMKAVTAQTDPENKACVGLLRSLGFTTKGMGWFIPEGAIHSREAGLGMSRGMIFFSKNIAGRPEDDAVHTGSID